MQKSQRKNDALNTKPQVTAKLTKKVGEPSVKIIKSGKVQLTPTEKISNPPEKSARDPKQAKIITLLQRPDGATIEELVTATGWQPHSLRGTLSGALKKRLGFTITSEATARGRLYRIIGSVSNL